MRPLVPALARGTLSDPDALQAPADLLKDGVNRSVQYPEPVLRAGSMNYEIAYSYEHLPLLGQGRHAIAWLTPDDTSGHMGTPQDTFDRLNHENLLCATRIIAAATARMGAGHVTLNATPHLPRVKAATGRVFQAADPNSVIPTRGVEGALIVARHGRRLKVASVRQEDIVTTDGDGHFAFAPSDSIKPPTLFDAFRMDPASGRIMAVKDAGERGEGSFPTARTWNNFDNPLRIVLFRCAQTDLFYPLHPSTSVGLGSAFSVETSTLSAPPSFAVMTGNPFRFHWGDHHRVYGQGFSLFNPSTARLYFGLRSHSPLDPTMESVVAYLLGDAKLPPRPPADREIWGPGYLAHDTPRLMMWQRQAAASMSAVDGFRLRRQARHRVADPLLLDQHSLASDLSDAANQAHARGDLATAVRSAQESLATSMEVYPRIGQTQRDAVIGVLFYLFLVIPFAVFTERLLFGFGDIRFQIAGVVGVSAGHQQHAQTKGADRVHVHHAGARHVRAPVADGGAARLEVQAHRGRPGALHGTADPVHAGGIAAGHGGAGREVRAERVRQPRLLARGKQPAPRRVRRHGRLARQAGRVQHGEVPILLLHQLRRLRSGGGQRHGHRRRPRGGAVV